MTAPTVSSTPLAALHCQPLEGQPPMTAAQIEAQLAVAPGWALVDAAIQKRYDFADYHRTMAFVNAVAWVAHVEDHHPDLLVSYNRCTVRYNTHSWAAFPSTISSAPPSWTRCSLDANAPPGWPGGGRPRPPGDGGNAGGPAGAVPDARQEE